MVASTKSLCESPALSVGEEHPSSTALDLSDRVATALHATGHFPTRNLRFEIAQDVVVLKGRVRSYFLKQLAQEALRAVLGGLRLSNEIEVSRS